MQRNVNNRRENNVNLTKKGHSLNRILKDLKFEEEQDDKATT